MGLDNGVAAERKIHATADGRGKKIGKVRIEMLQRGVSGTAESARAESADGFVDGDDAADFGGVGVLSVGLAVVRAKVPPGGGVAEQFKLRIDHFHAGGAKAIDFDFAVEDEQLARLEATFEIAAVKKFAGEGETGFVLYEQVVDGVASAHAAHGGTAGYAHPQSIDITRANILDEGKVNAVFVAEREIAEQVFESVDAALGEELGALRADSFEHTHVGF